MKCENGKEMSGIIVSQVALMSDGADDESLVLVEVGMLPLSSYASGTPCRSLCCLPSLSGDFLPGCAVKQLTSVGPNFYSISGVPSV